MGCPGRPHLSFPSSPQSVFILAPPDVNSAVVPKDLTLGITRSGQQADWRFLSNRSSERCSPLLLFFLSPFEGDHLSICPSVHSCSQHCVWTDVRGSFVLLVWENGTPD